MKNQIKSWGRMLAALLAAGGLPVWAQEAVTPAGEGTPEDPYRISQLGHLVWMGETVSQSSNKHYRLVNDIDASETAEWNEGDGFHGIGEPLTEENDFKGCFDGGGHAISNLFSTSRRGREVGLFGTLAPGSTVENLALIGGQFVTHREAGAITPFNRGGVIRRCLVASYVCGGYAGGVVGRQQDGRVEQCVVTGCVTAPYDAWNRERYGYVGGVVGYIENGTVTQGCSSAYVAATQRGGIVVWDEHITGPQMVSDSYWDVAAAGTPHSLFGGEGKTPAEMRRQETFAGWDFTNVWGIVEGASTPYLRQFPPPFTLQVVTNGAGRVEIEPDKAEYQPGERVTLTAYSDAPGYVFARWNGGESNLLTTVATVTMDGHRTLEAVFVKATDIATVEELHALGDMEGNYRLAQDIDATATTNWNDGAGFAPLGGSFTGIFDGNGHVIRGLTINRPGSHWVGLFSEVAGGGIVRRLGLEGGSVSGNVSVGTVAGVVDKGRLEECHSDCSVTGGGAAVGGLAGYLREGAVVSCHATGSVRGEDRVGGLVGDICGWNPPCLIARCYAMGPVEGVTCVGGLFGLGIDEFLVDRCFATGPVKGENPVGGLLGIGDGGSGNGSRLRRSFAVGAVSGEGAVSGLAGSGFGHIDPEGNTDMGECYAAGRVIRRAAGVSGGLVSGEMLLWQPPAYWDMETSGRWERGAGGLGTEFGRRTAQMKQRENYEGWDFDGAWAIEEGVSYPYLRGFGDGFRLNAVAAGAGHVEVSPRKAFYAPGEKVTLTAVPASNGVMLARWTGAVEDEDARVTRVTMDIHKTVVAEFARAIDISNVEELQQIGSGPDYPENGCYRLTQDIDASATTNWNDGAGFDPCARYTAWGFQGVLDGQSHRIKGLWINRPQENYVGLMVALSLGGTIRNLGLTDCSITGGWWVGGLAGENNGGRLKRCFAEASVTEGLPAGGLVGKHCGLIESCYAVGTVSSTGSAGGLAGEVAWNGRLLRCYAAAVVSGAPAGGLVGSHSFVGECVSTGACWDVQASGCAASAGAEAGKTMEEMMRQATFAGWDFSTEWGIDEDAGYPFLWSFRLALPAGVGVSSGGAERPAYAAWAAARTNAWGTADFSGVPRCDFETAWLLDARPEAGLAEVTDFEVDAFEVDGDEIRVGLALTVAGAAKQGAVNGWLAVEGQTELGGAWEAVAAQQFSDDRLSFTDGRAAVAFDRPAGHRFFRPILRASRGGCATALQPLVPAL